MDELVNIGPVINIDILAGRGQRHGSLQAYLKVNSRSVMNRIFKDLDARAIHRQQE